MDMPRSNAALALRLLLAPGMMTSADAGGRIKVTVCPGMDMGMAHAKPHGDAGHGVAKPCPYEALERPRSPPIR